MLIDSQLGFQSKPQLGDQREARGCSPSQLDIAALGAGILEIIDIGFKEQIRGPEGACGKVAAQQQPDFGAILHSLARVPFQVEHRIESNLFVRYAVEIAELYLVAFHVEM